MNGPRRDVLVLVEGIRRRLRDTAGKSRLVDLPAALGMAPLGTTALGGPPTAPIPIWNDVILFRIGSALHHIESTERILDAFSEAPPPTNDGEGWLRIFGALQALYVQQDAATKLLSSIEIETELVNKWLRIREFRNSAIGHPVERFKRAFRSAFFPESAGEDSLATITLRRVFYDGQPEFVEQVRLPSLVE